MESDAAGTLIPRLDNQTQSKPGQSTKRDIFIRFADLLIENAPKLGYLESIVVAKPAHFAEYEAIHAADSFKCTSYSMVMMSC